MRVGAGMHEAGVPRRVRGWRLHTPPPSVVAFGRHVIGDSARSFPHRNPLFAIGTGSAQSHGIASQQARIAWPHHVFSRRQRTMLLPLVDPALLKKQVRGYVARWSALWRGDTLLPHRWVPDALAALGCERNEAVLPGTRRRREQIGCCLPPSFVPIHISIHVSMRALNHQGSGGRAIS